MKTLLQSSIFFFILFIISSCDSDSLDMDNCNPSNWYGTYDKLSEVCDNGDQPLFEDVAIWEEGPCDNCLSDRSTTEYKIDGDCRVTHITPLDWEIVIELDGDLLHVEVSPIDCQVTYKRRG